MLVEAGIGDAVGAAFEGVPVETIPPLNDLTYRKHPKWNLGNGRFTDDCQMMTAVAETLLSGELTTANLADHFVKAYKRDPRPGYMPGFRKVLENCTNGHDFLDIIVPFSKRSGGAMRAAPCGLISNRHEAIDMAMFQASLTHATRQGMDAAAASALLVWLCLDGCPQDKLGATIRGEIPGYPWDEVWKWRVKVDGIPVVRAAIMAVSHFDNLQKILRLCIAFSGDTDTVAAVAMAAASMHPAISQNLPDNLYEGLENGEYGRDYLEELDWKLLNHYGVDHPHGLTPPEGLEIDTTIVKEDKGVLGLFEE